MNCCIFWSKNINIGAINPFIAFFIGLLEGILLEGKKKAALYRQLFLVWIIF